MTVRGTAVVTGAGSGIGRAVALSLAARGHEVIATGRRREAIDSTVAQIRDGGGRAIAVTLDVTDASAVEELFQSLAPSRIDVLVANAGAFARGPVAEMSSQDWSLQVDVNLTGVFNCLRPAVRVMRGQDVIDGSRGHVFTVNSGAGVVGFPQGAAYAASKHGLRGLVESVRAEVAADDIKVTDIVVSATVDSEMSRGRPVEKVPAATVGHTVVSCLNLPGAANWDRVDLGQIRH